MNVKLICKDINKNLITDILHSNKISIDDSSNILFVEEGQDVAGEYKVKVEFAIEALLDFIAAIKNSNNNWDIEDIVIGRDNESFVPVKVKDIVYINAIGNYTYTNLIDNKSYVIKYKLYQLEECLLPNNFIRINKSEIVNINKINLITPMFKGKLILNLLGYKTPFDISRNYTKSFKERLGL